ncbi:MULTISPECIES: hypothetical protein [Bradyrhizobium]|uniref:hypothetical protein n=1 Tax=Bradyrhizobium TaxID=374 RepID=UPI0004825244|nr:MULTISPECIES: hypothetical protein [Bradyrhizobium]UFW51093.1 hypothetical protein BaraCB756_08710 [Bradyrhizobium arachidis]
MQTEPPGVMMAFNQLPIGDLFLAFVDVTRVYGMRVKKGNDHAVLHLNGGEPKVVSEAHFTNRDALALRDARAS